MDRLSLCFEDLKVGDESPALVKEQVTRTDIVRYIGACCTDTNMVVSLADDILSDDGRALVII